MQDTACTATHILYTYVIIQTLSLSDLLSADVLTAQGAETVIAVDVGSETNNELTNYGDHVSGWYCLWNKINPLAKKIRVRGGREGRREGGEIKNGWREGRN